MVGRRLSFDSVSSPVAASAMSANHGEGESAVGADGDGGESGQVSHADPSSSATGMEPVWDQRTVRTYHLSYPSPPPPLSSFFHLIGIAADGAMH